MSNVSDQLNLAEKHRRAGRLREAAEMVREILRADPQQTNALNVLALVAHERGKLDYARQCIDHAIAIRPKYVPFLQTLGAILRSQGKLDEAIEIYRQCSELEPNSIATYFNVGNALRDKGQLPNAIAAYQAALKLDPDHPPCLHNLGQVVEQLGQPKAAAECYTKAIRLKPDYVEARVDLGNALATLGKTNAAAAMYVQALRYDPKCAKAHNNLGSLHRRQGKHESAISSYRAALRIEPKNPQLWCNLGNVLVEVGKFEDAEKCFAKALSVHPGYARAHMDWGNTHMRLGQLNEALNQYEKALEIDPQWAEAHVQRGRLWLLRADFQRGWPEYEWRSKSPRTRALYPQFPQPKWDGAPLDGARILLCTELEIGDTLQFVRYAPLVKERGGTVLLACPGKTVELLSGCSGIDEFVVPDQETPPEFDYYCSLVSLAGTFQTTSETIPSHVPYLHADPQGKTDWRDRLGDGGELKVGILWQGSTSDGQDKTRAIPAEKFLGLAGVKAVRFFCLQTGPGALQLAGLRDGLTVTELDIESDERRGTLVDTAAVITNLDLVIAPDIAVAHLAGALGVPVWVALSYMPDWRWQLDRSDCPWYPTMRLFRQSQPGDWDGVFEELASALQQLVASRQTTEDTETET